MPKQTLEQIDTQFNARIEVAPDDTTRQQLEHQKTAAVGDYYRQLAEEGQRERDRAIVLNEFPDADPAAVNGATLEEMKASAQTSQERFRSRTQSQQEEIERRAREEAAARAYGGQRQSGGGEAGDGKPSGDSAVTELVEDAWGKLRVGDGLTRGQADALVRTRVGQALRRGIERGVAAAGGYENKGGDE